MAAAAVMPPLVATSKMEVEATTTSTTTTQPSNDLYQEMKTLERQLEFVELQEEYLKDEMRHLQRELLRAKEEIRRIQSVPLIIGQFNEMIDTNYGIVNSSSGSTYYVRVLSTLDRELLKPNTSIALHRHSHSVVDILPPESDSTVQLMSEKPDVTYKDIGGADIQKQEVREAIELPLIQHHLYTQIGIDPPRGVFRLAKENSPCIVFIDEVDAIATKRFDAQTGADREVQRILLELLNQMDGFDQTTNVKCIMATNRADTLDPALLRPGRLDRKIEFAQPDRRQKRMVFQAATSLMNLGDEVDLEDYVNRSEKISHADVASICAEAGLQAVRENRYVVLPKDFDQAYKKAVNNREKELLFYSI